MNHEEENELFNRLEKDLAADSGGEVLSLEKARASRADRADAVATETGPSVVMVDGPAPVGPSGLGRWMGAKRRQVLPDWLQSTAEFKAVATWAAGYVGHITAYHAVRSPIYAGTLALRAPAGAAKTIGGTLRWVADAEGAPVRADAVAREDAGDYLKLSRQRDARVKLRTLITVLSTVVGLGAALALWILAPTWLLVIASMVVTAALGWAGAPADSPVISRAVEVPKMQRLTSDIVLRALASISIAQINQAVAKGGPGFVFTSPITRDGPGWRAEGDLPYGVTVSDVMDRRDRLASGLRRPLGCVWPEAVPDEHTGRLVLWVGDQDMSKAKQPTWPLAKSGTVDLFKPVAFGTDQRGRWVELTLMYIAAVIGAIPRMGKTFLLRLLLLIAALDPRAELHTYDLKGTGDLDPVGEKVSHRHRAGDDDADIEYAIADLRALREELRRRAKMIRSLPRDICPESKVTSELASKKSLGLHPIVIGVDECQVWFEHPKYGAEFEEICTDLVKRGPATGIVLLLATQRPDKDALPTGISANASARFCLKVMGQIENDMVLGTGSYKRGVRATMFAWADKGIHYFVGEGADARIVRSVYADAPTVEVIALRARKARERAGTLSGHALGEEPEVTTGPAFDLLADILAVVPAEEPKAWSETVLSRLAELRPAVYGGWEPDQLTGVLKPLGVATGQVWGKTEDGKGANRRGVTRSDITAAVTKRDGKPGAD
ncbi:cell division protein FtsK [Streptomyces sp. So13.3]|uniref:cell division protein FtsK n=1 Tax=Streptomyces sp. So13.3 TaxID=2136173 RepID=UPI001106B4CD|nr:cell division protein FtsK [Streptomyces sp. So13.3]QNA74184.1 cell division protein FtsK [Streptomyces sp. So13.3]